MDADQIIKRITNEIIAASAAVDGPDSDLYAYGQRLAYTNALTIILDACTSEYSVDSDESKMSDIQ